MNHLLRFFKESHGVDATRKLTGYIDHDYGLHVLPMDDNYSITILLYFYFTNKPEDKIQEYNETMGNIIDLKLSFLYKLYKTLCTYHEITCDMIIDKKNKKLTSNSGTHEISIVLSYIKNNWSIEKNNISISKKPLLTFHILNNCFEYRPIQVYLIKCGMNYNSRHCLDKLKLILSDDNDLFAELLNGVCDYLSFITGDINYDTLTININGCKYGCYIIISNFIEYVTDYPKVKTCDLHSAKRYHNQDIFSRLHDYSSSNCLIDIIVNSDPAKFPTIETHKEYFHKVSLKWIDNDKYDINKEILKISYYCSDLYINNFLDKIELKLNQLLETLPDEYSIDSHLKIIKSYKTNKVLGFVINDLETFDINIKPLTRSLNYINVEIIMMIQAVTCDILCDAFNANPGRAIIFKNSLGILSKNYKPILLHVVGFESFYEYKIKFCEFTDELAFSKDAEYRYYQFGFLGKSRNYLLDKIKIQNLWLRISEHAEMYLKTISQNIDNERLEHLKLKYNHLDVKIDIFHYPNDCKFRMESELPDGTKIKKIYGLKPVKSLQYIDNSIEEEDFYNVMKNEQHIIDIASYIAEIIFSDVFLTNKYYGCNNRTFINISVDGNRFKILYICRSKRVSLNEYQQQGFSSFNSINARIKNITQMITVQIYEKADKIFKEFCDNSQINYIPLKFNWNNIYIYINKSNSKHFCPKIILC